LSTGDVKCDGSGGDPLTDSSFSPSSWKETSPILESGEPGTEEEGDGNVGGEGGGDDSSDDIDDDGDGAVERTPRLWEQVMRGVGVDGV